MKVPVRYEILLWLSYLTSTVLLHSWSNISKESEILFCNSAADESDDSMVGFSGSLLGFGELTSAILLPKALPGYQKMAPATRQHEWLSKGMRVTTDL